MLIKKLSAIAALSGFAMFATPAMADDAADVKELLLKQQKQIEALQKKVEKQETVHNEALTHYIKNEIDRALEAKGGNLLTLGGSHVENLKIKGDLRVRYEAREDESGNTRDRFRQRFRLGFTWKTNEGWEIGAGFATGGSDATSTNDTYSEGSPFETGDLRLDYAYAKHKWENGFNVTLGQHKNPFVSSKLLWDGDVRFVGVTANWMDKDSGFFVTGGAYVVQSYLSDTGDDADANLYAAQVGIVNSGFTGALAYYHFDEQNSNNVLSTGDNEVSMASAYLEYAGKTDMFKYKFFGEYTMNFGADNSGTSQASGSPESEDTAWVLGGELGIDNFKFKYMYGHFESDSAFGPLTDSDFGDSLNTGNNTNNTEGHRFGLAYKVTKNFEVEATYMLVEAIDGGSGDDEGELFQLDFKYKF